MDADQMPSPEEIVAMQESGDRDTCREEIAAASGEDLRRVLREWWAVGLSAQRPDREKQYAEARYGHGHWTLIRHAA
ncbi:hypothetical protein [Streptomyces sp. NPDC049879]|uniref:hypothetical protein n=1 Tax=Streptomyces sp. NPDC049879 TaxID=3365598 RepID=UPI0037B8A3C9